MSQYHNLLYEQLFTLIRKEPENALAFDELIQRELPFLQKCAQGTVGRFCSAEIEPDDLAIEICAKLTKMWRSGELPPKMPTQDRFRAYTARMLSNRMKDYCRKQKLQQDHFVSGDDHDWENVPDQGTIPVPADYMRYDADRLQPALARLRAKNERHQRCAEMIQLRFFDKCPYADIAERHGKTESGVRGELSHNMKTLRDILERDKHEK